MILMESYKSTYAVLVVWVLFLMVKAVHSEEAVLFVTGLGGWGDGEMFGFSVWGFNNLNHPHSHEQNHMYYPDVVQAQTNLPVFVIDIGPFSSVHDRACEVWARVHSTQTDFGYWHAQQFGHTRYGRDFSDLDKYEPVFQQGGLGDIGADNSTNRVHIIGHSLGSLTARYFERVLYQGLSSELTPYPDGEASVSPFFVESGRNPIGWIKTMISISGPLSGSPLPVRVGEKFTHWFISLSIGIFTLLEKTLHGKAFYTIDMDHFGLDGRRPGETYKQMLHRLFRSPVFAPGFCDTGFFDVTPQSQINFNLAGPRTYPGTYYLAFATHQAKTVYERKCKWKFWKSREKATDVKHTLHTDLLFTVAGTVDVGGDLTDASHCEEEDIFKACLPEINITGPWTERGYGGFCFRNEYELNDGLVPAIISTGPLLGYPDDETRPKPLELEYKSEDDCNSWASFPDNQWYYIAVQRDHLQVVGLILNKDVPDVHNMYIRDIPGLINRVKTGGDPNSYTCCEGDWCQEPPFEIPPLYPETFTNVDLEKMRNEAQFPPAFCFT